MIELDLPFPVSANHLFANKRKGGRFPTKEYEAWKTKAGWVLKRQKQKPVKGKVSIMYTFEDGRKLDPDNGIKCVNDLLVTHGLIDGDGPQIIRTGYWGFLDGVKGVKVKVLPFI